MAIFASFARRKPAAGVATLEPDLPESLRLALPLRFEAVGEAVWSGSDVTGACSVAGRDVAQDGASVGEALGGLRTTYHLVSGLPPSFDAAEALSVAWSEESLQYLHQLSCEDPLTGLTSLAHVRTRIAEIYRDGEQSGDPVPADHALVVVEARSRLPADGPEHQFTRVLRLLQVAESIRSVFTGGQTIGRLGLERAVAFVPRTADLGGSVTMLRDVLVDLNRVDGIETRVWIEGLPPTNDSAGRLLDELAR